ncbi:MAG: hypothetical protein FJW32_13055 [Acidobacteria bacterium]|nr:hypothetical protein [Acidobacteriota bacterium]
MNEGGGRGGQKGRGFPRKKYYRPSKPQQSDNAGAQPANGESQSNGNNRNAGPVRRTGPRSRYGGRNTNTRQNGRNNNNRQQAPRTAGIKAQAKGGKFGENWWAKRWIEVLEGFEMGSRLNRGRDYAKKGHVLAIQIDEGQVTARVQGSRPKPYDIEVKMQTLPETDWSRVAARLAKQAVFSARLLAGEMPDDIEEIFEEEGLSLYPGAEGDLQSKCSCPDNANPCKHTAAVYLLLGEEFDRDPFLLFALRGLRREKLLAMIEKQLPLAAHAEGESAVDEKIEEPKQLLPPDPDVYWKGAVRLPEEVMGDVTPPPASAALPRRLGSFPFWQGQRPLIDALEPIYRRASQHAVGFLLGEPLS